MKKVAIITACYNDLTALKRTIESVRAQSFNDYLHLVVDGNSSDGTKEFLNDISNSDFYSISEPDKGVYDAINKGVLTANAEYVIVLNAGDTFFNAEVLKHVYQELSKNKCDFLIGRVVYKKRTGIIKEDSPTLPSRHVLEVSHQAFFYKKKLHQLLGLYDVSYRSAADYDFFNKVMQAYKGYEFEKLNIVISVREKFGGDSSDSVLHTREMLAIDKKNGVLMYTFIRRMMEICKKTLAKLIALR